MKKRFTGRIRKAGFALLQCGAWGVAVPLPQLARMDSPLFALLLLLLFLAGATMGIFGLVRWRLKGQLAWNLLKGAVGGLLASIGFWFVCLFAVETFLPPGIAHSPSAPGEPLPYIPLPFFTAGALALFGLGPFRSSVSPSLIVRQLIVGNRDLRLGGPARLEALAKAESLLGLSLPAPFREFLLDYGELHGTGITFLGLGPGTDLDHPSKDDFVGATLDARARLGLPQGYIVCSVDAEGALACLDTTPAEIEAPVVLWSPATRAAVRVAATSFPKYLIDTLRSKARLH
jgi:hypothetical protein